jgi:hypothetical protein
MNTGSDSHPLLQLCFLTGHRMSSDDIDGLPGDMNWAICYEDRLLRSVHLIVFKNKRAYKREVNFCCTQRVGLGKLGFLAPLCKVLSDQCAFYISSSWSFLSHWHSLFKALIVFTILSLATKQSGKENE